MGAPDPWWSVVNALELPKCTKWFYDTVTEGNFITTAGALKPLLIYQLTYLLLKESVRQY